MSRRPVFWFLFIAVALAGAVVAYRYFPSAFPVVGLQVEMDRETALREARALVEGHGWGPDGFRQAASFSRTDFNAQTYIELEGGGREALSELESRGLYRMYLWRVRHFRAGEATEATVLFTPAGDPHGFTLRLPEDEPGASLPPDSARSIAEAAAAAPPWRVDLAAFELIESSQEVRPGGRTDHRFVYERVADTVGEARFRLRLSVAGDQFSGLSPFVHVPEGFTRRFAETRAANEATGAITMLVVLVTLVLGGCGIGTFFLLRLRWTIWRPALAWGGVVALLLALSMLNTLPLNWMGYDTAVGERGFLLEIVLFAGAAFVFGAPLLGVIFMAAEGLSRLAFPDQLQQWRFWSRDVARSGPALGRTLGGYLLAPISLGYVTLFYMAAFSSWGWWTPSEALVDPNTLAHYAPWLSSVATAAFAAFWEESVFRAVPIAIAALIGRRYGRPGLWIAGAVVLQAVLFAAAHANYPQQPAYARVVELLLPAAFWGVVYVFYGLVPVILAHFAYNLSLMSLPLFTAAAPGLWLDRAILILVGLVPLMVILVARWRYGAVADAPGWAYNRAWRPGEEPGAAEAAVQPADVVPVAAGDVTAAASPAGAAAGEAGATHEGAAAASPGSTALPGRLRVPLAVAGVAGFLLWLAFTPFHYDSPPLEADRAAVLQAARDTLAAAGITLDDEWRSFATVAGSGTAQAHRFIWRESGPDVYHALLSSHLWAPHWRVRFARFTGPVEERAEEYFVRVGPDGRVFGLERRLPEGRPGDSLEEADARQLAHSAIRDGFGLEPGALREVSAVEQARPARRDWVFQYADPAAPLESGEARFHVRIGGDLVLDAYRYVHVPEEWERQAAAAGQRTMIVGLFGAFGIILVLGAGMVGGVLAWSRGRYRPTVFFIAFAALLAVHVAAMLNGLDAVLAGLPTEQPLNLMAGVTIGGLVVGAVLMATFSALPVGLMPTWLPAGANRVTGRGLLIAAVALGLAIAGASAVLGALAPRRAPLWGAYEQAGTHLPLLAEALAPIGGFVLAAVLLMLVLGGIEHWTRNWTRRQAVAVLGVLALGVLALNPGSMEDMPRWAVSGLLAGAGLMGIYLLARQVNLAMVPAAVAVVTVLETVPGMVSPAHGAAAGSVLAALLVLAVGVRWSQFLAGEVAPAAAAPPPPRAEVSHAGQVAGGD